LRETVRADAELAELVDVWPALPAAVRAGMVAMVRAASGLKA
jgi:hypothetical protein